MSREEIVFYWLLWAWDQKELIADLLAELDAQLLNEVSDETPIASIYLELDRDEGYFAFQDAYYALAGTFPCILPVRIWAYASRWIYLYTDPSNNQGFLEAFAAAWSPMSTGIGLFEMWGGAISDVNPRDTTGTAFNARAMLRISRGST